MRRAPLGTSLMAVLLVGGREIGWDELSGAGVERAERSFDDGGGGVLGELKPRPSLPEMLSLRLRILGLANMVFPLVVIEIPNLNAISVPVII